MAKEKTKWKWNEHKEWQDKQAEPEPEKNPLRAGQCVQCRAGGFTLQIKTRGRMDRICKNCGYTTKDI